jgi:hypothetical protein
MKELNYEIGQWIACSEGYGQIIFIRAYFVEDYEIDRKGRKNGEFIRYIYVIKILCGFDGKIKKSNRIKIDTSCSPIDKKGLKYLEKIKIDQKDEYNKYILYDEKNSLTDQLFLNYKLDVLEFDKDIVYNQIDEILYNLHPSFTYKDFANEFKKYEFPFKLENLVSGGTNLIELRFDSRLYKTKDKEAVFDHLRIIKIYN